MKRLVPIISMVFSPDVNVDVSNWYVLGVNLSIAPCQGLLGCSTPFTFTVNVSLITPSIFAEVIEPLYSTILEIFPSPTYPPK